MLQQSQPSTRNPDPDAVTAGPVVACAADDNYAMPLAVTMMSAARTLTAGSRLQLFALDGGISEQNRARLKESWSTEPIDVTWIDKEKLSGVADSVDGLTTSHHISEVAYYRILLPDVLPPSIDKVLYLDSDLLVLDDLAGLWEQSLHDCSLRAIPDVACPFVDARRGMSNFRFAGPYLASLRPIANYVELGIEPGAQYFNSGVLLIDVDRWRRDRLSSRMLNCLRSNEKHVWCWDQYALNAVMAGRWRALPLRWNLGSHAFEYPSYKHAPIEPGEFATACEDPAIVHFTTEFKPWHYRVGHPYRERFFELLDQTAWAGWRPHRPRFRLKKWWDARAVGIQKRWIISYRKLRAKWG